MKNTKRVTSRVIYMSIVSMGILSTGCCGPKEEPRSESKATSYTYSLNPTEVLIEQRADPFIYKHTDGYYYFTGSVPTYDRIELRRAKTIEELKNAATFDVWFRHESGPMSYHIWAPEIHYIDGKWYIYFASSERDDIWKLRPFVLECTGQDPLNDEWIELGMMQAADDDPKSFTDFSLDGTTFELNGKRYFIWAEKTGGQFAASNLYIAEMESPNKLKTVQFMLTTPDYDWERVGFWVNEGPAVIRYAGKIYITFSCSATGACYCMGLLEADENADLLDRNSWKKSRYPVLATDAEKGIYGPGHNSFTVAEDGITPLSIYHARDYEEIVGDPLYDPNRHARVMVVNFDDAGRPVFKY
ncbi:glycoside hydrolase family 43 protein [Xiashengella succiniciproducens]|jgi:GH43 family beta-xylosidase|uniref:Glycoside hydrolase family 43 protein n=1 Tax=Xiashengella succiniciproducens TaxID=2949635 RepID=A0A9J6ZS07_9BACT|nr:glycoside hydrolase family 43 protein [Alkaliflexus sp. Ai-910]MDI9538508.1 glycoside hydrolase family 43 protein [Bacteroidota bacterium]URW80385.1 glycoside hydrolase family 43 protein [Alkaliflexus sp. Ai-910]